MDALSAVARIEARIAKLRSQIKAIRAACAHPPEFVTYSYHGDTGNWCRTDDRYWTYIKCALCGDLTRVDGSPRVKGKQVDQCY